MKRLHPYRKMCRLMSANMLQKQVIVSLLVNDVKKKALDLISFSRDYLKTW
jgi:hypothetical protein